MSTSSSARPCGARGLRSLVRFGWALPVALVLALWAFAIPFAFAFDDQHDIVGNDAVHGLWPPRWAFGMRRPLVWLTFALNWAWSGPKPWSFRLVNVAIHATNAALVWGCTRASLRGVRGPGRGRVGAVEATAIATVATTLWAVHPLCTSAVTYVVHRYESLCALWLLAMLRAWQSGASSSDASAASCRYALAIAAALLAVVTKEIVVVGPALLVAYDWAYLRDRTTALQTLRRRWLVALNVVTYGAVAAYYPRVHGPLGSAEILSRSAYFRSEWGVVGRYLRLVVWPHPLSVDYFDWPVAESWRAAAPAGLAVLALVLAVAGLWVRAPRAGWLGLVFFGILAPTSTIIPLQQELVAERRMYLPLVAVIVGVVCALARSRRFNARVLLTLAALATVGLGVVTWRRNENYRTASALFLHDLEFRPNNARLHVSAATALEAEGRLAEAWPHLERARVLEPDMFEIELRLGMLATALGWTDRAAVHLEAAARQAPENEDAHVAATRVLIAAGRELRASRFAAESMALFPKSAALAEQRASLLATARDPAVVDGALSLRLARSAIRLSAPGAPSRSQQTTLATALAAVGRLEDARRIATDLLRQARANGELPLASVLESQLAAYAEGHRWTAPAPPPSEGPIVP